MIIEVKVLSESQHAFIYDVDPVTESVAALKQRVSKEVNRDVSHFRIMYKGRIMKDEHMLRDYDVSDNCKLYVKYVQLNSGSPMSSRQQSRFEAMLQQKLSKHFTIEATNKIIENLRNELSADVHSSSLDDLERLAKQKLTIV